MYKILIAEDEPRVIAFVEKGLRKQGFSTTVASNGAQALQAVQLESYDVILLDLGLPVQDGWTVLKTLREQANECPVIVVTALAEASRQDVLAAGAQDLVSKPFQFQQLLAAVQTQLKQVRR